MVLTPQPPQADSTYINIFVFETRKAKIDDFEDFEEEKRKNFNILNMSKFLKDTEIVCDYLTIPNGYVPTS